MGADGAAGIALASLAAAVVSFHGDERGGRVREKSRLRTSLVAEGGLQAVDHMEIYGALLHRFGNLQAGSLQEGGRQGAEVDHAAVGTPRILDAPGPANGQRHARARIIETGLGTGEGHAVVAGDHHDGVVELASLFQGGDRAADHPVEMLDLHEVIEKVVPHNRMVWEDRWHLHFGGILSRSSP